ncbi:MAG: glucose-6-phosphate dehydrogenase [Proteobacteria bacterium]|jgi:glucose-6-phosphate 1-dehydrogenase|nr:glucose-6-phosphate dehydrogenase [Pseudomonadota bacterium]
MDNDLQQFDLVLFGGTGDLVTRKLLPALYNAFSNNSLKQDSRIIALGRKELSKDEYCKFAYDKAVNAKHAIDDLRWKEFCTLIYYLKIDVNQSEQYTNLAHFLNHNITNIYYLSTAPNLFKPICENLAKAKLNHAKSRIVLEKPLGHDLQSSNEINEFVANFFEEQQIYRIDHYLGKESVQNLMAIRFGNTLFEALWRRQWICSIQITIAEKLGVESRGEFYNNTGALRDMLQNHLLQLLCIVAMEPPSSLNADTIRDEKLKVLKSLKPLTEESVLHNVIRGQYKSGAIDGKPVISYIEEENVPPDSNTETFVALKAEIQNWRWAGVPFYLRTGKRMQDKVAEIVIQFKDIPCKIFPSSMSNFANRLIIRLQPDETVQLYFLAKKPGDTNELQPVYLDLDFKKMVNAKHNPEGYERLLLDVIRGKLTLFVRRDEQQAAWSWVEPIINTWGKLNITPKAYTSGTWGPSAASALLAKDGISWHEELI